jgi:hypothetical protein
MTDTPIRRAINAAAKTHFSRCDALLAQLRAQQ